MKQFPTIHGFNECSEAGFKTFAPSIFLFGCNLRCPYCMNGRLVVLKENDNRPLPEVSIEIVEEYVKKSKSEWLMISGGEPTITPMKKLNNILDEIKSWGCKIGMSTNGTYPDRLKEIISKLNFVALDWKTSDFSLYADLDIKNKTAAFGNVMISRLNLLCEKRTRDDFDYEIRTTLYPKYINEDVLHDLGRMLENDETWVLQQFRHAKNMLIPEEAENIEPFLDQDLERVLRIAKKYTSNAYLRYV